MVRNRNLKAFSVTESSIAANLLFQVLSDFRQQESKM